MKTLLLLLALTVPLFAQEQALIDPATGEVVQTRDLSKLRKPAARRVWVPITRVEKPAFDSATQKLVRTKVADEKGVIYGWEVVALTQEELDARTAAQVERDLGDAQRAELRLLMAKLKDDTATIREIRRALFLLLRDNGFRVATP